MKKNFARIALFACLFLAGITLGILLFSPWADLSESGLIRASARVAHYGGDLAWSKPRDTHFPGTGARYGSINLSFGFAGIKIDDVLVRFRPFASLLSWGAVVRLDYAHGFLTLPGRDSLVLERGDVCLIARETEVRVKDICIRGDITADGHATLTCDSGNVTDVDILFSFPESLLPLIETVTRGIGELNRKKGGWRLKTR